MRRRYSRPSPSYTPQGTKPASDACTYKLFDSVAEIVERTESPVDSRNASHGHTGDKYVRTSGSWIGREFSSYAEMQKSANGIWTEGMAVLDKMRREISDMQLPMPVSRRRRMRWSEDSGDEVDNDRLRAGQKYWRESHRATRRGPATRTIVVDIGANCGTNPMDILWRGAATVALVEQLEQAGYRIELHAVWYTRRCFTDGNGGDCLIGVNLKRASDPLDVCSLINAVSGWFFRTVFFHELMRSERTCCYGLGSSTAPGTEQYDHITTDPDRLCVADVWNHRDAVAFVRKELQTLAGE